MRAFSKRWIAIPTGKFKNTSMAFVRPTGGDPAAATVSRSEELGLRVFGGPENAENKPRVVGKPCTHEKSGVFVTAAEFAKELFLNSFSSSPF
jgi:hypothetical protein